MFEVGDVVDYRYGSETRTRTGRIVRSLLTKQETTLYIIEEKPDNGIDSYTTFCVDREDIIPAAGDSAPDG